MENRVRRNRRNQNKTKNRLLIVVAMVLVVFIVITGSFSIWGVHKLRDIAGGMYAPLNNTSASEKQNNDGNKASAEIYSSMNILIMGTDARAGERARSDTLMIATVNMETKKVLLTSIPRDTYAKIPGYGSTKINHAMASGGPSLAIETVENFLGINIDHYVTVNFEGFHSAIDVIGGVYVDVDRDMRYYDPTDGTDINLKKGYQLLDGKNALDFVRYRSDSEADFGRIRRQQELIRAVTERVVSSTSITRVIPFLEAISKGVLTDIHPQKMEEMAKQLFGIRSSEVVSLPVESRSYIGSDDIWYVEIKELERQRIKREIDIFKNEKQQ